MVALPLTSTLDSVHLGGCWRGSIVSHSFRWLGSRGAVANDHLGGIRVTVCFRPLVVMTRRWLLASIHRGTSLVSRLVTESSSCPGSWLFCLALDSSRCNVLSDSSRIIYYDISGTTSGGTPGSSTRSILSGILLLIPACPRFDVAFPWLLL